jgi:hypothetical protein
MSAPDPSPVSAGTTGSSASQAYGSGGYGQSGSSVQALADAGSYQSDQSADSEPDKPGLIDRFKETRAYDKLQQEVSVLGDRFIEELSSVGRNVVLPALFSKVKDLFGVDLSNKQSAGGQRQASATGTGGTASGAAQGAYAGGSGQTSGGGTSGAAGSSGTGGTASGGGPSYATSENRGY